MLGSGIPGKEACGIYHRQGKHEASLSFNSRSPFEQLWSKLPFWGTNVLSICLTQYTYKTGDRLPLLLWALSQTNYFMDVLLAICIGSLNSFRLMPCTWSLGCGFSRDSLLLCLYSIMCDETMLNEAFDFNTCLTKWWKERWDWGSWLDLSLPVVFVISGKWLHLCTAGSMFQFCLIGI